MLNKVNNNYRTNLNLLPFPKKFHFVSRLWLWAKDEEMARILPLLKDDFCKNGDLEKLDVIIKQLIETPLQEFGSKNAAEERRPYFKKYPLLRPTLLVLFRLLFCETIYGIDGRSLIEKNFDIQKLDEMEEALLQDKPAISVLSTHAINFIYLYNRFYKKREDTVPVQYLFELAESIDTADNLNMLLYIYLVTHCVIGESLFYKRNIPSDKTSLYREAMYKLEDKIDTRYDDVNMDNKFEMLVCFRILGLQSRLTERIYSEANASLSGEGDFIVDTLNNNPQLENIDFEKSEHRNVLYLLSNIEFRPTDEILAT